MDFSDKLTCRAMRYILSDGKGSVPMWHTVTQLIDFGFVSSYRGGHIVTDEGHFQIMFKAMEKAFNS